MRQRFTIVIERAPGNYGAYVPDVPGCSATGATMEETRARLAAALADHLAVMAEYADPLPEPVTTLRTVRLLSPDDLVTTIAVDLPARVAATTGLAVSG